MTLVIDGGCYDHPDHQGSSQDSVRKLVERFAPRELHGYDPHPKMPDMASYSQDGCRIALIRRALWTDNSTVPYDLPASSPLSARVGHGGAPVPCVDIAQVVDGGDPGERVILKLDVEGAEYRLLRRLIQTGAIRRVDRILVEWHDPVADVLEELMRRIPCPVEEWT